LTSTANVTDPWPASVGGPLSVVPPVHWFALQVAGEVQVPQLSMLPHPSEIAPQVAFSDEQVFGEQVPTPQTSDVPPPPHVSGDPQVPHMSAPPHLSGLFPQLTWRPAQVAGTHPVGPPSWCAVIPSRSLLASSPPSCPAVAFADEEQAPRSTSPDESPSALPARWIQWFMLLLTSSKPLSIVYTR
jgi:hypothetical protein